MGIDDTQKVVIFNEYLMFICVVFGIFDVNGLFNKFECYIHVLAHVIGFS